MNEYTKTDAVFSPCKLYRYSLERWWSPFAQGRAVNFIMLNPSTATATESDPTVTRCIGFAQSWGFDGLIVTNLFALRSTEPAKLRQVADPFGPDNDGHIISVGQEAALIICAWGTHGRYKNRGMHVEALLREHGLTLHCLGMTKAYKTKAEPPMPKHPLYLKGDTRPEVFTA